MSVTVIIALLVAIFSILFFAWLDRDKISATCYLCDDDFGDEAWIDQDGWHYFCSPECLEEWNTLAHEHAYLSVLPD